MRPIDSDALIESLRKMYRAAEKWGYDAKDEEIKIRAESCMAGLVEVKLRIEGMPTIDPARWIPVSEKLPEEDTDVLISYRYKEGEGDTSHVYIDITSYGDMYFGGRKVKGAKHWRQPFEYFTSNYEVIAWMPLPEPWKGEEDV